MLSCPAVYEFQCVHLLKPQQDFLAFQLASIGFNFYLDTWLSYIQEFGENRLAIRQFLLCFKDSGIF